jgi:hypothetical protein
MLIYFLIIIGGIILGLILGLISLRDIYLGPNSREIVKLKFKKDDKCYRLIPEEIKCGIFDNHI